MQWAQHVRDERAFRGAAHYFESALSLWALVSGHWSTWQAAYAEAAQQEQNEKAIQILNVLFIGNRRMFRSLR